MGLVISSSTASGAQISEIENNKKPDVSVSKVAAILEKFNMDSKSGIGVHMFCFTPPPAFSNTSAAGTDGKGKIYIASEVTDDNDVLDVKYSEWKKKFVATAENESEKFESKQQQQSSSASMFPLWKFVEPQSKLRIVWSPTHRFSSGRLAMVAVQALLNQGYTMKECDPESEMKI